ncbi:MAG TPA: NlpC/P60 family protein [Terriglobales bacterium]|nr:NlpC/P60 family protein [Terriglobales bacterium]
MVHKTQTVVLVLLVVLCATTCLLAQQGTLATLDGAGHSGDTAVHTYSSSQLLTLNEGLAVIGAALETRHHFHGSRDCSHFVHDIYQRAGFDYSYENSITLYEGTENFQRISRPQPGDLIVWRGHVGIVVNPAQHSFFSALRSGFGVEDYQSSYWRKRGHPRFFRYVKSTATGLVAQAGLHGSLPTNTVTEPASVAMNTQQPMAVPQISPEQLVSDSAIVLGSRPNSQEVEEALRQKFTDAAEAADAQMLRSPGAVIIFDQIKVKKLRLKRDVSWAEVRIDEPSALIAGQPTLQKRSERERWPMSRNENGRWTLTLPQNVVYVPKEVAVRVLVRQLATMTDHQGRPGQTAPATAELAKLLNVLLGE